MSLRPLAVAFVLAAGIVPLTPGTAAARKIMLITHGDTVHEYSPLSVQLPGMPTNLVVGYKYSYGGLFFLDFWTWGGEYCIYDAVGKKYDPLTREQAAALLGKKEGEIGKPFWYRFPHVPFGLAVAAALFVPIGLLGKAAGARERKKVARLMEEPKYLEAVAAATTLGAGDIQSRKDRFEAGVAILARSGIPEDEARKNLKLLVQNQTPGSDG